MVYQKILQFESLQGGVGGGFWSCRPPAPAPPDVAGMVRLHLGALSPARGALWIRKIMEVSANIVIFAWSPV